LLKHTGTTAASPEGCLDFLMSLARELLLGMQLMGCFALRVA